MRLLWQWMWHARQRTTAGIMLLAIRIKWRRLADTICRIGARVLPDDKATFLAMRGSFQMDMGKPEKAIQLYQEIMKERPADAGCTALLAKAYECAGDTAQALAHYRLAVERADPQMNPDYIAHLRSKATALERSGLGNA